MTEVCGIIRHIVIEKLNREPVSEHAREKLIEDTRVSEVSLSRVIESHEAHYRSAVYCDYISMGYSHEDAKVRIDKVFVRARRDIVRHQPPEISAALDDVNIPTPEGFMVTDPRKIHHAGKNPQQRLELAKRGEIFGRPLPLFWLKTDSRPQRP